MKSIEGLKETFKYGAFSLPAVNYMLLEENLPKECREVLCILKLAWKGNFKEAIQKTDKILKSCKSEAAKYFLLANKLAFLKYTGKVDMNLYRYLKRNLPKMSKSIRDTVIVTLINFEASGIKPLRKVRVWKNDYRKSTLSFLYLSLARREADSGRLSEAVHDYIQAYRLSREVPHPTCIVSSLNDLAWDIREKHPKLAHALSQGAVFWLGYYREEPGNLFGALDTLFVVEKDMDSPSIHSTAHIIVSLPVPEDYLSLLKKAKKFVLDYTGSTYPNTSQLRRYVEKVAWKGKTLSSKGISDILKGKTKMIRADTIRKLLTSGVDTGAPFPVWNEWIKMEIERKYRESSEKLKELPFHQRQILFLTTYMALLDREFLSRKEKLKKAYTLLEDIESFADFMAKDHRTMEFVVSMVKAHPFVEGRKEAVKRALARMKRKRLERFVLRYIEMKESDRKLLDRFLRNYGRYDGVRFGMRLKGPEMVREFAKKYSLKVQPLFAAFWCEEDGRVRRRLERILKYMFLN
ncbi:MULTISPECIES: hypothetical protein [unclassified Thermotoga]|uniref:hypothetical protein n=1 Tax=unclassified Thermotoga TaxID=2631113 RepID=UPI0005408FFA|nr:MULTISPECIES: hypothetical protein [unclassified Thermotoga]AIY88770.1 hypothetical protein CELL2_07545 [Thermotoga sp. Cell2]KHC92930.1 hypothetical protein TBGT1765_02817 [Thermotoga sp. TBGT1765]KHC94339.1 hypothetical protein TBGT1766_02499 [Thermotoga sp. TBGT1766]KHC95723.1 hypothetical protein XYL54_07511 [Thermotoga sp. Xyl54]